MWKFWRRRNRWLKEYREGSRDFSGEDFSGQSFEGAVLEGVRMAGANFSGTNLRNVTISRSDLSLCNFERADFSSAKLDRVVFTGSKFPAAKFRGATLFLCNFELAFIGNNDFTDCKIGNTTFKDAFLAGTDFSDTSVAMCHFEGCKAATRRQLHQGAGDIARVDQRNIHDIEKSLANRYNDNTLRLTRTMYAERQKRIDEWTGEGKASIGLDMFASIDSLREFFQSTSMAEDAVADLVDQFHAASRTKAVFISYAGADEELAAAFHDRLSRRGFKTWFAPRNMEGGQAVLDQLMASIGEIDILLLIVSGASMTSEWVGREIGAGIGQEKVLGRTVVFPVRTVSYEAMKGWQLVDAGTGEDIAAGLRARFIPDVSGWRDPVIFGEALEALVKDLAKIERRETRAAGPPPRSAGLSSSGSASVSDGTAPVPTFDSAIKAYNRLRAEGDPLADMIVGQLRRDSTGNWCTVHQEENRYIKTCKMCGRFEQIEPGLTPSRCCGECGLERDTDGARQWLQLERSAGEYWMGYDEKSSTPVVVRCKDCAQEVTFSFRDGPPLACPRCG